MSVLIFHSVKIFMLSISVYSNRYTSIQQQTTYRHAVKYYQIGSPLNFYENEVKSYTIHPLL